MCGELQVVVLGIRVKGGFGLWGLGVSLGWVVGFGGLGMFRLGFED